MKSLVIAALLVLFTGSAALAGTCQPPEPLSASILICGDPHAYITVTGEGTVRLVWTTAAGERKVIYREVDGERTFHRLVKGGGTKVAAYDGNTVLARVRAYSGVPCNLQEA